MSKPVERSPFRFGLLGWQLSHSLSPTVHAAALAACQLDGNYELYPAPPLANGETDLRDLVQRLRRGELHGLNVTIPHKQSIMPFLDHLTPLAKQISAVNLVYVENGFLIGDNSDAPAFKKDLQDMPGFKNQPGKALILGAGGAARAAAYALLQDRWDVIIASRREEAARQLEEDLRSKLAVGEGQLTALPLASRTLSDLQDCALVINATPVGMFPHIDQSPWPEEVPLPPHAAFYDMVYNPTETAMTKAAHQAGLAAASGLGMFVEQAALSFERWTGLPAPREIMREAAKNSFHS